MKAEEEKIKKVGSVFSSQKQIKNLDIKKLLGKKNLLKVNKIFLFVEGIEQITRGKEQ